MLSLEDPCGGAVGVGDGSYTVGAAMSFVEVIASNVLLYQLERTPKIYGLLPAIQLACSLYGR